ncbi:MAG: glycosyltransferase family 39 protein [Bacteroidota bacterium]|nr:glycosyltransferase family 39 protein [Bacteroidota bacterium]
MTAARKSHDRNGRRSGPPRPWLPLLSLAALSLLLRLVFLLALQDTPFYQNHFSDSRLYMQLARDIMSGSGIEGAFFMSPLYPYLLAAVWKLTGAPELWMRVLQMFFGTGTVLVVFVIGRKVFSHRTGILAAALTATYTPLIFYDGMLLLESLLTLLLTLSLLFLLNALREGRLRDWALAGLTLGAAAVTRANILLFLPVFLLLWMFVPRLRDAASRKHVLWYTAIVLACLIPTTLHNAAEEGAFIPVTDSFGYNLYAGNNPEAAGLYTMPEPVDLYTDLNGRAWVQQQSGTQMNAAEVSAWWRDRALTWMGAHPGDAMLLMGKKLLLFFHPAEIDQLGLSMEFFTSRYGGIAGLPQAVFPVLLVLSMIGMALSLTGEHRWQRLLPLLLLAVYVAATVLFFVSGRLRIPVMPLLLLYAAYAVAAVTDAWRRSDTLRRFLPPAGGGLVIGLALLFLQPGVEQDYSHEYIKLGQLAFERGDYAEAERHFRFSVAQRKTVDGLTNLGNSLAAQRKLTVAADQYRAALRMDSTAALAWFNFGNLWMQSQKPQYAYGYWKKAITYNPRLPDAHRNLGLLLMQAGRLDEAEQALRTYVELEKDPGRRAEIMRDLERIEAARRAPPRPENSPPRP